MSPGLTFATRAEAAAYLDAARAEMDRANRPNLRDGQKRFGDWASEYMATKVDLAPKTGAAYDNMLNNHILPAFGAVPINTIRPLAVRRFLADLAEKGLGPRHRRKIRMLFCQILKAAVSEGLIANTPCVAVKPPRVPRPLPDYLTTDEIDRLLAALCPPWDLLVLTMIFGGLRYGEAAALRRSSCDVERARLSVDESMTEFKGGVTFGPTKTHQHRQVSLPGFVRDRLVSHLETDVGPELDALVFTFSTGEPARYSKFRRKVWVPAALRAGLDGITTHICRHTAATLLIGAGAAVKDVQMHLGHADASITLNVYCAPHDGKLDDLALRINSAWRVARGEERRPEPRILDGDPRARRRRRQRSRRSGRQTPGRR